MAAPYVVEVRTGGNIKCYLRRIIYDVAERFDVHGAARPRAVPHITLFGPYDTNRGYEVKQRLLSVYKEYDIVPYRIEGFGCFRENDVIYAKVVPSSGLRALRRDISRELRPLTYNSRSWDSDYYYDFHITVVFKDVGEQFEEIWSYVNETYKPQFDEYAARISSLDRRKMMWEYDLLQQRIFTSKEATTAASWKKTTDLLKERSSPDDHLGIHATKNPVLRYVKSSGARLFGRW